MRYKQFGKTGLNVSALAVGSVVFDRTTVTEGVRTLKAAFDAGINIVDTANAYSAGEAEEVVGEAIQGRRDEVVVATKVWGPMGSDPNARGSSRRHIKQQCDASLARLGTDYIDIYQLHRPDPETPIAESLSALDDLVRAGKVHYVGISTFMPSWLAVESILTARLIGCAQPVSEQPPYNLLDRSVEQDLLPLARKYGLAVMPWSPLAYGLLTGKYQGGVPDGSRLATKPEIVDSPAFEAAVKATGRLSDVAAEAGITVAQLALAWLLAQPGVTCPVIGPRTASQLPELLAAADIELEPSVLAVIDDIVPPGSAVFPLGD